MSLCYTYSCFFFLLKNIWSHLVVNHYFWNWQIYNFISPEKNINRKFYFPLIASQLLFFLPSLKALVFARQIEDFFPTFPFLTRFALEVDDSGWHLLPLIFSRMPNLESFVFEVDEVRMWWAFSWTVTQIFFASDVYFSVIRILILIVGGLKNHCLCLIVCCHMSRELKWGDLRVGKMNWNWSNSC